MEDTSSVYSESILGDAVPGGLVIPYNPSVNKKEYRNDKKCTVCQKSFNMMGSMKKHFCKFCYRGVCIKCSNQAAFHPELNTNVRVCDSCYNMAVLQSVSENCQQEVAKQRTLAESAKEVLMAEVKSKNAARLEKDKLSAEYEELSEALGNEEYELNKKLNDLRTANIKSGTNSEMMINKYNSMSTESREKDIRIERLNQELKRMKEDTGTDKEKVAQIRQLLSDQENENLQLKQSLKKLEEQNETEIPGFRMSKEAELSNSIQRLKEQIYEIEKQNKNLKLKLKELKEEKASRNSNVSYLSNQLSQHSNPNSTVDSASIRYLKEQLSNQQGEIIVLKRQLDSNYSELSEDPEFHTEPARGRCNCSIL